MGYYKLNSTGTDPCIVTTRVYGDDSSWHSSPAAPDYFGHYQIHIWNDKFPSCKLPVPASCPVPPGFQPSTPKPSPVTPPPAQQTAPTGPFVKPDGPITGDKDNCAPAMPQRTDGRETVPTEKHLEMPKTGGWFGFRNGSAYIGTSTEPFYVGAPEYTTHPKVTVDARGNLIVVNLGSGPGGNVFAPGNFNEYMIRGDGVHPEGRWPTKIPQNSLIIMAGAAVHGGDSVQNIGGIGLPGAGTHKPRSGWYYRLDLSTGTLWWSGTTATGADTTAKAFGVNGYVMMPEISAPSTPPTGMVAIYPKSDGKLYAKDDAGTEYDLTASGGGVTSVSGTAPIASSGGATPAISLNDDGVTNAKLDNMNANTVKVNATNGSANPTDLALTAGTFLGRSSAGDIEAKAASDNGFALVAAANYAAMRTLLDLEAGTDFYSIAATDAAIAARTPGASIQNDDATADDDPVLTSDLTVTLEDATTYGIDCYFICQMGTSGETFHFDFFGGNATFSIFDITVTAQGPTEGEVAVGVGTSENDDFDILFAADDEFRVHVTGVVRTTSAGTVRPRYWTNAGQSGYFAAGSCMNFDKKTLIAN